MTAFVVKVKGKNKPDFFKSIHCNKDKKAREGEMNISSKYVRERWGIEYYEETKRDL